MIEEGLNTKKRKPDSPLSGLPKTLGSLQKTRNRATTSATTSSPSTIRDRTRLPTVAARRITSIPAGSKDNGGPRSPFEPFTVGQYRQGLTTTTSLSPSKTSINLEKKYTSDGEKNNRASISGNTVSKSGRKDKRKSKSEGIKNPGGRNSEGGETRRKGAASVVNPYLKFKPSFLTSTSVITTPTTSATSPVIGPKAASHVLGTRNTSAKTTSQTLPQPAKEASLETSSSTKTLTGATSLAITSPPQSTVRRTTLTTATIPTTDGSVRAEHRHTPAPPHSPHAPSLRWWEINLAKTTEAAPSQSMDVTAKRIAGLVADTDSGSDQQETKLTYRVISDQEKSRGIQVKTKQLSSIYRSGKVDGKVLPGENKTPYVKHNDDKTLPIEQAAKLKETEHTTPVHEKEVKADQVPLTTTSDKPGRQQQRQKLSGWLRPTKKNTSTIPTTSREAGSTFSTLIISTSTSTLPTPIPSTHASLRISSTSDLLPPAAGASSSVSPQRRPTVDQNSARGSGVDEKRPKGSGWLFGVLTTPVVVGKTSTEKSSSTETATREPSATSSPGVSQKPKMQSPMVKTNKDAVKSDSPAKENKAIYEPRESNTFSKEEDLPKLSSTLKSAADKLSQPTPATGTGFTKPTVRITSTSTGRGSIASGSLATSSAITATRDTTSGATPTLETKILSIDARSKDSGSDSRNLIRVRTTETPDIARTSGSKRTEDGFSPDDKHTTKSTRRDTDGSRNSAGPDSSTESGTVFANRNSDIAGFKTKIKSPADSQSKVLATTHSQHKVHNTTTLPSQTLGSTWTEDNVSTKMTVQSPADRKVNTTDHLQNESNEVKATSSGGASGLLRTSTHSPTTMSAQSIRARMSSSTPVNNQVRNSTPASNTRRNNTPVSSIFSGMKSDGGLATQTGVTASLGSLSPTSVSTSPSTVTATTNRNTTLKVTVKVRTVNQTTSAPRSAVYKKHRGDVPVRAHEHLPASFSADRTVERSQGSVTFTSTTKDAVTSPSLTVFDVSGTDHKIFGDSAARGTMAVTKTPEKLNTTDAQTTQTRYSMAPSRSTNSISPDMSAVGRWGVSPRSLHSTPTTRPFRWRVPRTLPLAPLTTPPPPPRRQEEDPNVRTLSKNPFAGPWVQPKEHTRRIHNGMARWLKPPRSFKPGLLTSLVEQAVKWWQKEEDGKQKERKWWQRGSGQEQESVEVYAGNARLTGLAERMWMTRPPVTGKQVTRDCDKDVDVEQFKVNADR